MNAKGTFVTALVVVFVVALGMTLSLRLSQAGQVWMWLVLAGAYLPLGVWALVYFGKAGLLRERLSMKYGDPSLGIVLGLILAGAGVLGIKTVAPTGSLAESWLFRLYWYAGDVQKSGTLILLLFVIVTLEELVWRGLVLDRLQSALPRAAPPLSAGLYALAHVPTVWLLSDPAAGLNPLLVVAALGCGLVWAYARVILGRLFPVIICHVIFTYFMAAPLPAWFR